MLRNNWAIWIFVINTLVIVVINPILGIDVERYFDPTTMYGKVYLPLQVVAHIILFVVIYKQVKLIRQKYYFLNKYPEVVGKNLETGDILYAAMSWSTAKVYKLIKPIDARVSKNLQMQQEQEVKKRNKVYENFHQDMRSLMATVKKLHEASRSLKFQFKDARDTDIDWLKDNRQLSNDVYPQILELLPGLLKLDIHHVFQVPESFEDFYCELFGFNEKNSKKTINMLDVKQINRIITAVMEFNDDIDEVRDTIHKYTSKIAEAEQANNKINDTKQNIAKQAEEILENPKIKAKLTKTDKDSLTSIIEQAKKQVNPRDMRKMQHLFDQIKEKLA